MFWTNLLIFLLLTAGLFALWGVDPRDLLPRRRKSKPPLSEVIREAQGRRRKGIWKEGGEIDRLLSATGRPGRRKQVIRISLLAFAVGAVLPVLFGNPYLSPVLGTGFALTPLYLLRSRETAYRKRLSQEAANATSIITTSYLRTDDLVQSVRENLPYLGSSVKDAFSEFIYNTEMISANIPAALARLQAQVPNNIFQEWCSILIQCQSDRTLKHTLQVVADKFSEVRDVQSDLDTMLSQPRKEAVTMMFLVAANVPLLYLLNRDWYQTLMYSTPGRIALAISAGIILFALVRILSLSKPVEYTR